jgi:hypothetical protein
MDQAAVPLTPDRTGVPKEGVNVPVIADKTTRRGRPSGIDPLTMADVPIWMDDWA